MGPKFKVFFLVMIIEVLIVAANTNSEDVAALSALKSVWKNTPPSWVGVDPCGSNWEGISCNNTRVTTLILSGLNIEGSLTSDLLSLSELQYLDLSNNKDLTGTLPAAIGNLKELSVLMLIGCGLFGPIPDSIGSLDKLLFLALNSNNFSGPIPASIGNLSSLSWLDLTDNKLSGPLPVSLGTTNGLDNLVKAKHFHLGQNQLSGTIPAQLFHSEMNIIHLIFDNNRFTGQIPATLVDVQTLEVVRLDWNSLNGSVPANLSSLTTVSELYLSNNNLNGSIPDLTGMEFLNSVDMSNNSFNPSNVPNWFTSLLALTTLKMERTQIRGDIPAGLFNLSQLQSLVLSNNQLNGTLNLGTSNSNLLSFVDLQNNQITSVTQSSGPGMNLKLEGNPICNGPGLTQSYCIPKNSNSSNAIPANCPSATCGSNSVLSPNCKCAHPYTGTINFIAFNYSNLDNSSYYGALVVSFMSTFKANNLPVDSVFLGNPTIDLNSYLQFRMEMFPSGQDRFNRSGVLAIGTFLNRNPLLVRNSFGPFFFIDENYCCFEGIPAGHSTHTGLIAGVAIGCSLLLLLLIGAGIYAVRQKKRAQRAEYNPFASWNPDQGNGGIPQLKGARWFSFEEIKKCTDSFSESNCIGIGGYGKVYKGTIEGGQIVAIKRAQQGSLQGANEFKTEIELLSRIHHKNVVNLVGFCYEHGEQMLVYEYVPNGTLKDSITGKSGIELNWMRRLNIALDSARGLSYMHELADPPIIHRDVKTPNILLDDHLNAKVADFGLCKLLGDTDKGYVTTQVKGTLGYMDPEYYMTQQLTNKSDVYSFGIVLLELLTGKPPIERGKYIVRVVKEAMNKSKDHYTLPEIVDPSLESIPGGLNKYLNLAMSCVTDGGAERPKMSEIVREIENILLFATSEIKNTSVTSSSSYESGNARNYYPRHSNEDLFAYSGGDVDLDLDRR